MDDYNFDVPDGMDLMVFEEGSDACMSDNFKCSGRQVGH